MRSVVTGGLPLASCSGSVIVSALSCVYQCGANHEGHASGKFALIVRWTLRGSRARQTGHSPLRQDGACAVLTQPDGSRQCDSAAFSAQVSARVWQVIPGSSGMGSDSRPCTPPDGLVRVILSAVCVAGLSTVCTVLRGGDPKSSAPSRLRPVPPGQRQTAAHGTSSFECARVHLRV